MFIGSSTFSPPRTSLEMPVQDSKSPAWKNPPVLNSHVGEKGSTNTPCHSGTEAGPGITGPVSYLYLTGPAMPGPASVPECQTGPTGLALAGPVWTHRGQDPASRSETGPDYARHESGPRRGRIRPAMTG